MSVKLFVVVLAAIPLTSSGAVDNESNSFSAANTTSLNRGPRTPGGIAAAGARGNADSVNPRPGFFHHRRLGALVGKTSRILQKIPIIRTGIVAGMCAQASETLSKPSKTLSGDLGQLYVQRKLSNSTHFNNKSYVVPKCRACEKNSAVGPDYYYYKYYYHHYANGRCLRNAIECGVETHAKGYRSFAIRDDLPGNIRGCVVDEWEGQVFWGNGPYTYNWELCGMTSPTYHYARMLAPVKINNPVVTKTGNFVASMAFSQAELNLNPVSHGPPLDIFWRGVWDTIFAILFVPWFYKRRTVPKFDGKPNPTAEINTGLFKCFDDPYVAAISCCCPGVRWADSIAMTGAAGDWGVGNVVTFWTLFMVFQAGFYLSKCMGPLALLIMPVMMSYFRQQIRSILQMHSYTFDTIFTDFIYALFCQCCFIAQEARVVNQMGVVGMLVNVHIPSSDIGDTEKLSPEAPSYSSTESATQPSG